MVDDRGTVRVDLEKEIAAAADSVPGLRAVYEAMKSSPRRYLMRYVPGTIGGFAYQYDLNDPANGGSDGYGGQALAGYARYSRYQNTPRSLVGLHELVHLYGIETNGKKGSHDLPLFLLLSAYLSSRGYDKNPDVVP